MTSAESENTSTPPSSVPIYSFFTYTHSLSINYSVEEQIGVMETVGHVYNKKDLEEENAIWILDRLFLGHIQIIILKFQFTNSPCYKCGRLLLVSVSEGAS